MKLAEREAELAKLIISNNRSMKELLLAFRLENWEEVRICLLNLPYTMKYLSKRGELFLRAYCRKHKLPIEKFTLWKSLKI